MSLTIREGELYDRLPRRAKRELSPGAYKSLAGIVEQQRGNERIVTYRDEDAARDAGYSDAGSLRRYYPELERTGWLIRRDVCRGLRTVEFLFTHRHKRQPIKDRLLSQARASAQPGEQDSSPICARARAPHYKERESGENKERIPVPSPSGICAPPPPKSQPAGPVRDGTVSAPPGSGTGAEPAPARFQPTERDQSASRLVQRLRARGLDLKPQDDGQVKLVTRVAGTAPPDAAELAELKRLKPEVVRWLRGWPKPSEAGRPRPPGRFQPATGFPASETARLLGLHARGEPGAADALAAHLAGRYHDVGNAVTKSHYLRAIQHLGPELVRDLVAETEATAERPARFLAHKFRKFLGPLGGRPEERTGPRATLGS